MFRYLLAASLLKLFSLNKFSRGLYRKVGNTVGKGQTSPRSLAARFARSRFLVDLCTKHNAIKSGDTLLEIGTGWFNWYAIYLRLYYDVSITMLDIWDNRQFKFMKLCFAELQKDVGSNVLLCKVLSAKSFDEIYEMLNLEYVIDEDGSLSRFPDNSFDCVFSFNVLEHIPRSKVNEEIKHFYRVLKLGGLSIHLIGIDDHLSHYDKRESPKKYLAYPDRTWTRLFENKVQYFNRLQMSDWLGLFEKEGFSLDEKVVESCDYPLRIDEKYRRYKKEDLAYTALTVVHQKR